MQENERESAEKVDFAGENIKKEGAQITKPLQIPTVSVVQHYVCIIDVICVLHLNKFKKLS